jgi:hypothetical protein
LRLVIFDPPSVKILHGMLDNHQYPCHLMLLNVLSDQSRSPLPRVILKFADVTVTEIRRLVHEATTPGPPAA